MHDLIIWWFKFLEEWRYLGVFLLMAAELSVIPVPSELVIPPAAFWTLPEQGERMTLWGVVAAGTAGSWFGSAVSYWLSLWVGRPLVMRFGKYLLMTPRKIDLAEAWAAHDGLKGVFIARLLPVLRHLISIPAGILRMPFLKFSVVTTLGAGLWCLILAWWGRQVLTKRPELLHDPNALIAVVKEKMIWFVGAVIVFGVLLFVALRKRKPAASP